VRHAFGMGLRTACALKKTFMMRSYSARVDDVILIRPEVWLLDREEGRDELEILSSSRTGMYWLMAVSCDSCC
jgi:hypothetical protein